MKPKIGALTLLIFRSQRENRLLFRSLRLCSTKRVTVSIAVADNRVDYHDDETPRRDSPPEPVEGEPRTSVSACPRRR